MKPEPSTDSDARFRARLREWKVTATLPPGFQGQVWQRIERLESQPSFSVSLRKWMTDWISVVLPRPALAVSYVAILLTIGLSAGWAQARQETARVKGELGDRYIRTLDPYQPPRQ